jgi:hypothetical protein
MNWCEDPLVNALKSYGYNLVKLPKADIKPLYLLGKDGKDLTYFGQISQLLTGHENAPVPPIQENIKVVNISVSKSHNIDSGIGLAVMGNFLSSMGGSAADLKTQYSKAGGLSFEYSDVLEDRIDKIVLDQFLAKAKITSSPLVDVMLEKDQIYIVTSTLKSNKFTVEAVDNSNAKLEVDVKSLQDSVGSNIKVSEQTSTKITFEGAEYLVFGFQAVQLLYQNGRYRLFKSTSASLKEFGEESDDSTKRTELLQSDAPFLRLNS